MTIVPGLWDMHAHAGQTDWAPVYLASGVTTIRDMGGEEAFLVAIRDAGAYGSAMASNYNRRPLPAEVLVDAGAWRVIRRRQTVDDMLALEDA